MIRTESPLMITANGIRIAYLERAATADAPLVICLHGFPDTAWNFVPVLNALAARGYRAVAPFLRGYAPTELPVDGDVCWATLAADLIALICALSPNAPVYVVGHDWGSIILQLASKQEPQLFRRIVLCAVPHLRRFFFLPSLKQLARSHYILRFQAPRWAERRLPRDDFDWIKNVLIRRWSPTWQFDDATLNSMVASFRDPARLKAAIDYYRGLCAALLDSKLRRLVFAPITVPAMMIYGSEDGCIGAEMYARQEHLFSAGLTMCEATGRGHFMNIEDPAWFAQQLDTWFAQDSRT